MNSWLKNWHVRMPSFYIHILFSLEVNTRFQLRRKKREIYPKAKQAGRSHFLHQHLAPSPAAAVHTSVSTARACGTVQKDVWEEIKVKNTKLFGYVLSPD